MTHVHVCNNAGQPPRTVPTANDAAQVPSAGSRDRAPVQTTPVLLVFADGEDGEQHAEALRDAIAHHIPSVQLISGFQVFPEAQAMEGSSLHFHGGVASACAKAWKTHQASQGPTKFVSILQSQLDTAGSLVDDYQCQTQGFWTSAKVMWQQSRLYNTEATAAQSALQFFLENFWPVEARDWGMTFEHVTAGSEFLQQLGVRAQAMLSSAALQGVLISKPEPCSTLPQFLSGFKKNECRILAEMLTKLHDVVTWQQPTLAAFLIQDPQEVAALNDFVQQIRVELLVTLTLQCTKFTLSRSIHVNGLDTNGTLAQCDVSVQLYAYASRQMQGVLLSYFTNCVR